MKLLSLIPTPQHVVTAEINNRTQGQVIDITVYNETKSFRAVSVADNEVEKTDGRSFGRSSNTFWAAMYNGKEILLFVQGTGADRKIVRIDTELEQLKRLLRTSVNDYPQGKFLFNMDKARVFYPGYNWLYNLTKREISKVAHTTPLADIIDNCPTQSFKGMFPLLNKSIPPRIQKGLFFTENEVFWLDRSADTISKLTDHFYSPLVVKKEQSVEAIDDPVTTHEITLPYRTIDKKWVAPRGEVDVLPLLLKDVEEHISIAPVTRITAQNKTTHKNYGQYFIPNQGLYGKEMLTAELVANLRNRLADDYSIIMRGKGFELLYTKFDVNAIYLRARGETQYTCDLPKLEETQTVVEQQPVVEETPVVTEEPQKTAVQEMNPGEYENRQVQLLGDSNLSIKVPSVEDLINSAQDIQQEQRAVENTETTLVPAIQAQLNELDAWFQDIVDSPVLYNTNINLPVTRLAMNRVCLVELPKPYGLLLAWVDMTHDKNVAALELGNNDLVSFAAATFYCKDGRVYMTETHVRLDTTTPIELPAPKPPKEALQEAVSVALKEMSLVEVLSIVTASAA